MNNIRLYRHPLSGHSHRAQLFLSAAAGQVAYGPAAARLVNVFGAVLVGPYRNPARIRVDAGYSSGARCLNARHFVA